MSSNSNPESRKQTPNKAVELFQSKNQQKKNVGNNEWAQLKGELQGYLVTPDWMAQRRKLVQKFQKMTRQVHVGFKKLFDQILHRPLPSATPKLPYLSTKTGTILIKRKAFPMKKSISLTDFKDFYDYKTLFDDYKAFSSAETGTLKNPLFKRVWANSHHALSSLGKKPKLKRGVGQDQNYVNDSEFPANEDMLEDDDESVGSKEEEIVIDDNYSEVDEKCFNLMKNEDESEVPPILNAIPYKNKLMILM